MRKNVAVKKKESQLSTILSISLHIVVVAAFNIKAKFFPTEAIEYQRAIRVDMVALPDKIQEQAAKAVKKVEAQKIDKPKPAPKPKPKPAPKKDVVNLNKKSRKDIMNDALKKLNALEKIKKEVAQEEKEEVKEIEYKGNILSAGSSIDGINKIQYDNYLENLDSKVKQNWNIPSWMAQGDFKAKALVKISPDGFVIHKSIIESSGNQLYDEAVLETITKSSPFPPPPDKFVEILEVDGLVLGFPE